MRVTRLLIKRAQSLDWHILAAAVALMAVGLCFVWSATLFMDKIAHGFSAQFSRIALSLPFLFLGFFIPLSWVKRNAFLIYAGAIVLLLGLFFFGLERNNARRWFLIGGSFTIQPSEFMKLGMILALANWLMYRRRCETFGKVFLTLLLIGGPALLILKQPDLGTALVLLPIGFSMLFVAGARIRHLIWIGLCVLLLAPVGYLFLKPYQKERVEVWLRQDELTAQEKRNQGYHLYNAKISIGSGGWIGQGLGRGLQNQYDLLPERHTDFIAALMGEELGFLGLVSILLLYFLLVVLLFSLSMRLREPFSRLLVVGVAAFFMTHLFINVGVASGFLPTTGVTLPLISYGGSSTMTSFAALGLALNAGSRRQREFGEEGFEGYEMA